MRTHPYGVESEDLNSIEDWVVVVVVVVVVDGCWVMNERRRETMSMKSTSHHLDDSHNQVLPKHFMIRCN